MISLDYEYSCDCFSETETVKKLHNFARVLKEKGATLIGNLKIIVRTDSGGYLLITTTSFEESPHTKGKLPQSFSKIKITFNAIVYGITEEDLKSEANKFMNFTEEK